MRIQLLALMALATCMVSARLDAEEFEFTTAKSLDSIVSEVDALKNRVDVLERQNNKKSCCNPCCYSPGVNAGMEVVWLELHHSRGLPNGFDPDIRPDFEPTGRFWIGYTGERGVGFRFRYWEYDHVNIGRGGGLGSFHNLETNVFDAEILGNIDLGCCWAMTAFGGYRYVEYDEDVGITSPNGLLFGGGFQSERHGLTLGAELRRSLRRITLFANARASALYGDEDEFFGGTLADHEENNLGFIYETQMGIEVNRRTARGATLFARALLEAQYWDSFSGEFGFDGGEATGFIGGGFSVGIRR